jgi:hypothetical protein
LLQVYPASTSSGPLRSEAHLHRVVVGIAYGDEVTVAAEPHSSQTELEIACRRLREATNRLPELTKGLEERTAWALRLEKELEERTAWALRLNKEVEEQNAWALRLDKELQERCKEFEQVAWARHIHPRVVKFLNSLFMTARDCRNRIRELVSRHHFSE